MKLGTLGSLIKLFLESGSGTSSITKENCGLKYLFQNMVTGVTWRGKEGNLVGRKLDKEKLLAAVLFNWMFVSLLV